MSEYGVTKEGFVKKRFDTILEEMQSDIKEATDIDISTNPQSYINTVLSSVADKIAGIYEVAEGVYYSHYPSTADGVNLDYACQLGGVTRKEASPTKIYMLCTATDGTVIEENVKVGSKTKPVIYFKPCSVSAVASAAFNKATIVGIGDFVSGATYKVTLDDIGYEASGSSLEDVFDALAAAINANAVSGEERLFSAERDGDTLVIESGAMYTNHTLVLSENMTTDTVSSIILFQSVENGAYKLPAGTVTGDWSLSAATGAKITYTNLEACILGNERETDAELRNSYLSKQYARSSGMVASIVAAIYENVESVTSCVGFENDGDEKDTEGRPPHSIEIVVDSDEAHDAEIAQTIFDYKAAGIQTFGEVSVPVPLDNNTEVTVNFNRPLPIRAAITITLMQNSKEAMPENYEDLTKEAFEEFASDIEYGTDIALQKAVPYIDAKVSGILYMEITANYTLEVTETETETYTNANYIIVDSRHKAVFESVTVTKK